jgi:hypothetical protein
VCQRRRTALHLIQFPIEFLISSKQCYFAISIPDVSYLFVESDDVLEATACSSESHVYFLMADLQRNCSDSYCIASVYSEVEACASVQFQSVIGETYCIIFQTSPDSGSGNFTLSVNSSSSVQGPENDLCSNALLVDLSRNKPLLVRLQMQFKTFMMKTTA